MTLPKQQAGPGGREPPDPAALDRVRDALLASQRYRVSIDQVRRHEARVARRRRAESAAAAQVVGRVDTLRVSGRGRPGTIVLAHGGGFVSGAPELCLALAESLAGASGCDVVLPRYRLAPEHPAPAAGQDVAAVAAAVAAWPGGAVLAGCSAGAAVALTAGMALRGRPGPRRPGLRGLVLVSPWVDLRLVTPTLARAGQPDAAVSVAELERCASAYRGALAPADPLASPVFGDLAGLPPVLIQVGTDEALHGDAALLAARLRRAGVPCRLSEWPQMIHNWQFFGQLLPAAAAAIDEAAAWARRALSGGPPPSQP